MSANPESVSGDTRPREPLTPIQREGLWLLQSSLLRQAKVQREELRVRRLAHENADRTQEQNIEELDARAEALAQLLREDEPPYDGY